MTALFYVDCPSCARRYGLPFYRQGGPTVVEHFCGKTARPRKARFLVMPSGHGYVAYQFSPNERVEPVMAAFIERWIAGVRDTTLTPAPRQGHIASMR